jgi:uncharacterized protein (DUF58 family)
MKTPLWLEAMRTRRREDREAFRALAKEAGPYSVKRSPAIYRIIFYGWDYLLTPGGKLFLAAFAVTGLAGIITPSIPLYQVPLALIVFLSIAAGFAHLISMGKIHAKGNFPEKVTAGQLVRGTCTIVRKGAWPVYDISAGCFLLPRSWEFDSEHRTVRKLSQDVPVTLPIELRPRKRGLYALPPIRVFTTFPFNLLRFELTRAPGAQLLVLPKFHSVTSIELEVGSRYQPGGMTLTSHVGESPEFIGNRNYLPGDSLRRIDFRSWARLARPVVREYQEEYYCRIALVLDTFIQRSRRPGRDGFPELEAAVSLSATVADALAHGEYIIDLFAAGPELHVFRAGRHTAHFENVLEILACVGPCRDNPFQKVTPALVNELASVSTLVCVFLDWDADRAALVQSALEAGCSVKVLIVRNGETTLPVGAEGAVFQQLTPEQVQAGGYSSL